LNLNAVRQILADSTLQTFFQAALLTANRGGYTIRELSEQLDIPRSTLHRWISQARDRSQKIPRVEVTAPPVGAQECNHRRLYSDKRKRVCLRCLLSNFEGSPELRRHANFDPVPEDAPPPPRKFKPKLKKKAK
jgi:transposase-like protein